MYYTFCYEDYNGNKGEVCVKADSESGAKEKLSSYNVSRGELHYSWLKSISNYGSEKYYVPQNTNNIGLAVALFGTAIGCTQLHMYNIKRDYTECLKDDTVLQLIKHK